MDVVEVPRERYAELARMFDARLPAADPAEVRMLLCDPTLTDRLVVLAATEGDAVLGWGCLAHLRAHPPGWRAVRVLVPAEHEGRGVGSALHAAVLARAAADPAELLRSGAFDDDARSLRVAAHWGWTVEQCSITSRLDLDGVAPPVTPDGVTLEDASSLSFADRGDVERMLDASQTNPERANGFVIDLAVLTGMLGETERPAVALLRVDGRPAALSFGGVAGEVAHIGYTGVDPAFRGRGLGRLVKQHVHVVARDAGARWCDTDNEEHNAGIRRVNADLGYRRLYGRYSLTKTP